MAQILVKRQIFCLFDKRNLVEQILHQAERTEPAADKAPDQRSRNHQKPDDIEGKFEVPAADDCLERADWAGADCARAGVAI